MLKKHKHTPQKTKNFDPQNKHTTLGLGLKLTLLTHKRMYPKKQIKNDGGMRQW